MRRIARAVILLSITFLAFGCGDDKQPSTDSSSARDDTEQIATAEAAKMYSYEILNTVEYTGSGSFSQQAAGVMAVNKQPLESGKVAYTYSFVADTSPDGGKTIGQITLPAVTILRDPQTERIVGLIRDLKRRGLLDETLVMISGEFGRTYWSQDISGTSPIEKHGREHQQERFCTLLAGGGVKPGCVHGETDAFGYRPIEGRVHLHDLHATILHLLGIDHERLTYAHVGRDFRLTDVYGRVVRDILA